MQPGETIVKGEVGDAVIGAPIPQPAPPAEDQKGIPPEGEAPPEAVAETTEQQEAKKQSKFQRRLDRQKAARVAAETELRLTKERLAQLEAQPKPQPDSAEPKREAFENLEDYLRAVAKYDAAKVADEKLGKEREARGAEDRTRHAEAENRRLAKDWQERETAYQSATKDYAEVVAPFVEEELNSFSEVARRAIVESEVGPQLLYHLAQNSDVAEAIAELSPVRQAAEIGKLEAKMTPVSRKESKAPPPAKTVTGAKSAPQGYSENMTDAEYREWRKGQGATWAR